MMMCICLEWKQSGLFFSLFFILTWIFQLSAVKCFIFPLDHGPPISNKRTIITNSLLVVPQQKDTQRYDFNNNSPLILFASPSSKKIRGNRKKGNTNSGSIGFGGITIQPCPCGSTVPYNKCCGRLHTDAIVYAQSSADEVVRARYSAYARRIVDFIIVSTHPDHNSFVQDIQHWKSMIEKDCYDDFELTKCDILSTTTTTEMINDDNNKNNVEIATVCFIAHMKERDTQKRTSFMETSTFHRHPTTGAWLYKEGIVETIDDDDKNTKS